MRVNGTDISMTRGDTESITVSLKDAGGEFVPFADGDKVELTIRVTPTNPVKLLHKVCTEFMDGKALFEILPADTERMHFGDKFYDIQLTQADGTVITIIKPSRFTILSEVTYG